MSTAGAPRHTAERSKSRRSKKKVVETPKNRKIRPSGRLGPVLSSATPQRTTIGGARAFSDQFYQERKERQARHAARLAKEPPLTLIVGGVNPFDQKNKAEAVKKFKKLVAQRFSANSTIAGGNETTIAKPQKLVFREEDEMDGENEAENEQWTIVIDD